MQPKVHETILDNGLKVLLKETHASPVTSTWLWYRVGSRNEVEGSTGLSHWVEHMMFKDHRATQRARSCAWSTARAAI